MRYTINLLFVVVMRNFLIGCALGILLTGCLSWCLYKKNIKKIEFASEEVIKQSKQKIDSLYSCIDYLEEQVNMYKDSIKTVEIIVEKRVETIKYLPMDSNITLLKENLVEYGEFTTAECEYPKLEEKDSLAILNQENVKDVNIIALRFGSSIEKYRLLSEVLEREEEESRIKSCVIVEKDNLLQLQDSIYNQNYNALQEKYREDIKKRNLWIAGGTALGITVGALVSSITILATSNR